MLNQKKLDPRNIIIDPSSPKEPRLPWFPPIHDVDSGIDCYPNLSDWWPGDILLFSKCVDATQPALSAGLIETIQDSLLLQRAEDAQWISAAIYIGNGACVEAINHQHAKQKGIIVNLNSLPTRVSHEAIRVRRVKLTRGGLKWERAHGRYVAMAALSCTSLYYQDMITASQKIVAQIIPNPPPGWQNILQLSDIVGAAFSTLLCMIAVSKAQGFDITMKPQKLPFALSQSLKLEDVDVSWREVMP